MYMPAIYDNTVCAFFEPKRQVQPGSVARKTFDKMEEPLGANSNLVYAGYPYDPSELDAAKY